MGRMRGWKTWTGGGLLAGATFLQALGYPEFGQMLGNFGLTFLGVGIAHKIEKAANGKAIAIEGASKPEGFGRGAR